MSETNPIITSTDPRITEDDRALARRIIEFIEYDAGNHPMRQDHYWIVAAKIAQFRREQCCRTADIMGDDPSGIKRLVWYRDDGWEHGGAAETWKDHAQELEKELSGVDEYIAGLCEARAGQQPSQAETEEVERLNLEMARIADEEKNALVDTPPLERIVPAPKWEETPWPDNGYWCGRYMTMTMGRNGEPEQSAEVEAIKPPRDGLRPCYTDGAWYWMEVR
jgi:hypothetical protein